MLAATALILLSSLGPAEVGSTAPTLAHLPALHSSAAPLSRSTAPVDLALRSPLLEADAAMARQFRTQRLAQTATPEATATTQAAPTGAAADPAAATPPAAGEPEEPDIALMRQRASITRVHRPLGIATFATMLFTEILGTVAAVDQRTVFGNGACQSMSGGILGDFSCNGSLTTLHLISAFATTSLYTATGIYALSMPDPEHARAGNDRRGSTLRLHRALAFGHLTGMILLPLLGILSVNPGVVGVTVHGSTAAALAASAADVQNFQADMRTIHLFVGYATLALLTTAMIIEL